MYVGNMSLHIHTFNCIAEMTYTLYSSLSSHYYTIPNTHNLEEEGFIWFTILVGSVQSWLAGSRVETHGGRASWKKAAHPMEPGSREKGVARDKNIPF